MMMHPSRDLVHLNFNVQKTETLCLAYVITYIFQNLCYCRILVHINESDQHYDFAKFIIDFCGKRLRNIRSYAIIKL